MARERRDADRRSRQCAKFARLLRLTRLLLGHGRWGPDDLAREVECSPRTVYRDIEVLSAAGIPVYYDKTVQAYRVREGFKFPGLESGRPDGDPASVTPDLLAAARRLVRDGEALLADLRRLCDRLEAARRGD